MTTPTLDDRRASESPQAGAAPARLTSLDAYRGFVMFLMMAEVLALARVARARPDSALWQFLAHHQSHVAWIGCSLHDLIQPSFSFLVGVALPFSLASRAARGQSRARMAAAGVIGLAAGATLGWVGVCPAEAHLDPELGALQRGLVLPAVRGFLLGD